MTQQYMKLNTGAKEILTTAKASGPYHLINMH